ncbi:MAG: UDP-N-acetylmuramate dehydrogenase [Eubacteriales bacterium]|nr:UDP-N-acetylmuramate dehydrogenase [Eubacteriales bacterium]
MFEALDAKTAAVFSAADVRENVPLRSYTSFCIGGPCDYFYDMRSIPELQSVLNVARRVGIEMTTMGKGSNLLVSDRGVRGLVCHIGDAFANMRLVDASEVSKLDKIEMAEIPAASTTLAQAGSPVPRRIDDASPKCRYVEAQAGVSLAALAEFAAERGLSGLEFARGIPGSFGGGLRMNAGAYGEAMHNIVVASQALLSDGTVINLVGAEHCFAYRHSRFEAEGLIVLSSIIRLVEADPADIRAKMRDLQQRRRQSQPLEHASAGSVFKRPEGHYASKLIMEAGLKGLRVGGAEVSTKHAGFIVNPERTASASDVLALIRKIESIILEKYAVKLELELQLCGDYGEEALGL